MPSSESTSKFIIMHYDADSHVLGMTKLTAPHDMEEVGKRVSTPP